MGVDDRYSIRVRDRDMVWLDTDQLSVLLVSVIDSSESPAAPALVEQPKVGESSCARTGDVTKSTRTKVRKKIEEKRKEEERVGRDEEREKHISLACLERGSNTRISGILQAAECRYQILQCQSRILCLQQQDAHATASMIHICIVIAASRMRRRSRGVTESICHFAD